MCKPMTEMNTWSAQDDSCQKSKLSVGTKGLSAKQIEAAEHGPLLNFKRARMERKYSEWYTRSIVESFEEQPFNVFNIVIVFMLTMHASRLADEECNSVCTFFAFCLLPMLCLAPLFFQNVMDRSTYIQHREVIVGFIRFGFMCVACAVHHPAVSVMSDWDASTLAAGLAWTFLSSASLRVRLVAHIPLQIASVAIRMGFGMDALAGATPLALASSAAWYLFTDVAASSAMVVVLESFSRMAFLKETFGSGEDLDSPRAAPAPGSSNPAVIDPELQKMLNTILSDNMKRISKEKVCLTEAEEDMFLTNYFRDASEMEAVEQTVARKQRREARHDSRLTPTYEMAMASAYTLASASSLGTAH